MKNEVIDSAASYSVAGASLLVALANSAQHITVILACLVVFIRLIYDGVRLYRYLKGGNDE